MNCSGLSQTARALDKGIHGRAIKSTSFPGFSPTRRASRREPWEGGCYQVQKAAYFSIKIGYLSWKIEVGCPIQSRGNLEYSTLQPNMAEATVVLHVA